MKLEVFGKISVMGNSHGMLMCMLLLMTLLMSTEHKPDKKAHSQLPY